MHTRLAAVVVLALLACVSAQGHFRLANSECAVQDDKKVTLTSTSFSSGPRDIFWLDDDTVFMTTYGSVVRSTDQGKSWSDLSNKLEGFGQTATLEDKVYQLYLTSDDSTVYLQGWDERHWVSRDKGETFTVFTTENAVLEFIEVHPTNPGWVIGLVMLPECFEFDRDGNCHQEMWLSKDFGESWEVVEKYVWYFQWGDTESEEGQLFFLGNKKQYGNQYDYEDREAMLANRQFMRSPDCGVSVDVIFPKCSGFLYSEKKLFLAKADDDSDRLNLYVSHDGGHHLELQHFPENVGQKSYVIIQDTPGLTMLAVGGDVSYYGALMISDSSDEEFTYSLERIKMGSAGSTSILRVPGLDSVYISNSYSEKVKDDPSHYPLYIESLITFDEGGEWQRMRSSDCGDQDTKDCAQHILLSGTNFLAHENAIGLIVAKGNSGEFTQPSWSESSAFISRDGGISWSPFFDGNGMVEFGDHGGLMMYLPDKSPSVHFTWSQGLKWAECKVFPDGTDLDWTGIESPPNAKDIDFFAIGRVYDQTSSAFKHFAVHFDYTTYGTRQCAGAENPNTLNSDYENENQECLLGEIVQYTRRKQASECYNGIEFEDRSTKGTCPCTIEDYECDGECFASQAESSICSNICSGRLNDPFLQPDTCQKEGDTWRRSRGYRLVPGTKCHIDGGLDLLPETVDCVIEAVPTPTPTPTEIPTVVVYVETTEDDGDGNQEPPSAFFSLLGLIAVAAVIILVLLGVAFLVYRKFVQSKAGPSPDQYYTDSDL